MQSAPERSGDGSRPAPRLGRRPADVSRGERVSLRDVREARISFSVGAGPWIGGTAPREGCRPHNCSGPRRYPRIVR
jgi:hypothetical protein